MNLTAFGAGERRDLGKLHSGLQWSQVKPGDRLCYRQVDCSLKKSGELYDESSTETTPNYHLFRPDIHR